MDETIKLLREQTVLCTHLPELFDELIKIVQSNSPDVQATVTKIETAMRDLNRNSQKSQEFLQRVKAASFTEYLAAQDMNIQREVAEKLLHKAANSQQRLKNQVAELKLLLERGRHYVEFNLNILARISASDTYGAGAQTGSQRSRRMFDANI